MLRWLFLLFDRSPLQQVVPGVVGVHAICPHPVGAVTHLNVDGHRIMESIEMLLEDANRHAVVVELIVTTEGQESAWSRRLQLMLR